MELEVCQNPNEAQQLFLQAWNEAPNGFEKFTAAQFVARRQSSGEEKLKWDETALAPALTANTTDNDKISLCQRLQIQKSFRRQRRRSIMLSPT